MSLSESELQIAQAVLGEIKNSTYAITDAATQAGSYGYEVLIRGTVMSGIANIICIVIGSIIFAYGANRMYKWAKNTGDDDTFMMMVLGWLVLLVVLIIFLLGFVHPSLMAVFVPEYTVLNKLLELAISK